MVRCCCGGPLGHRFRDCAVCALLTVTCPDVLGGNCITLMMGCVRQGDWETSLATLRQLATARRWALGQICAGSVDKLALWQLGC